MFDKIILMGKVISQPVISEKYATFTMETNRWKSTKTHRIIAFKLMIDKCRNMNEGDYVYVNGEYQEREYKGNNTISIFAQNIENILTNKQTEDISMHEVDDVPF